MKQVFIGIFAHPDDESFGPSGTMALEIKKGADVHLICATSGQSGMNPDAHDNLGKIRTKEWLDAGKLLGAHSQHQLGYHDGELSNNQFIEIANKIEKIVTDIMQKYTKNTEVVFVTMDQNGISGHIDHILVSFVTCYVFEKLKSDKRLKNIWFHSASESEIPSPDISFVYMPKGRAKKEIDITIDIYSVYELKKQIMRKHVSQRNDAEWIIDMYEKSPVKEEYFYTYY